VRNMHAEFPRAVGLLTETHEPSQTADLRGLPSTAVNEVILRAGYRARLLVPLVRSARSWARWSSGARRPANFLRNTVELLKTFAAQSVLAIQNAALVCGDRGQEPAALGASQHKSQFLANMSHELRTPAQCHYRRHRDATGGRRGGKADTEPLDRVLGAGRHLLG